MSQNRRRLLLVFGYVLLIFIVSSIPSLTAPGPDFVPKDKLAHLVEYFVLGVLLFKGIGWTATRSRAATFGFVFAVGVSIAALDEIYQSFVPGRTMSILDWCADAAGTAAGCGTFIFSHLGKRPGETGRPDATGAGGEGIE
jgi:VanZ family protein